MLEPLLAALCAWHTAARRSRTDAVFVTLRAEPEFHRHAIQDHPHFGEIKRWYGAVLDTELLDDVARLARQQRDAILQGAIVRLGCLDDVGIVFALAVSTPELIRWADAVAPPRMDALEAAVNLADFVGRCCLSNAEQLEIAQPSDLRCEPRVEPDCLLKLRETLDTFSARGSVVSRRSPLG